MNTRCKDHGGSEASAIIAYLVIALIVLGTIATLSSYVIGNIQLSSRRQDMARAYQYAQGGAALACRDVEAAFTNSGSWLENLSKGGGALYKKNGPLSDPTRLVYERTITSPFTNQTVDLQLWMTNSKAPLRVKVLATAQVGHSVQTVQANLEIGFGHGAAILSTPPGTTSSGASKGTAQAGNAVVAGSGQGITRIDGQILSNGKANVGSALVDDVSELLYGTAEEIPDYTSPGSDYQLFDFARFTAVADVMGTHYTNLSQFVGEAATGQVMEGVIVVDIPKDDNGSLEPKTLPYGINVHGTLVFRFGPGWKPLDKVVNTATMNINAANLTGLVATKPATYTSGYPPVYNDPKRDPARVNIQPLGFENFKPEDDLPALMYNNAILDIHGDANICGVVYSSSFMEIENKSDGQTQYFRGALIGGGGIYVENGKQSTSIVSYDPNALDLLATYQHRGQSVNLVYQK